jgi:hypothetical protein
MLRHLKEHMILGGFALLNLPLLGVSQAEIPKQDIVACALGLMALLTMPRMIPHDSHTTLVPSKSFHKTFAVLSSCEVLFLIAIPWILIILEILGWSNSDEKANSAQYLLAPHLFVFQSQIALEALAMKDGAWVLFIYTCVANTYRYLALATGLERAGSSGEVGSLPGFGRGVMLPMHLLLVLSLVLWVASNAFILLRWYPQLPPMIRKHEN